MVAGQRAAGGLLSFSVTIQRTTVAGSFALLCVKPSEGRESECVRRGREGVPLSQEGGERVSRHERRGGERRRGGGSSSKSAETSLIVNVLAQSQGESLRAAFSFSDFFVFLVSVLL